MKLRTKLVLLVSGAAALFLLSIGAYLTLLAPVDSMEKESGYMIELSRATANLQVETGLLLVKPMGPQFDAFNDAITRYHTALDAIKKIVVLRAANAELKAAIEAVDSLGDLSEGGLKAVSSAIDDVKAAATEAKFTYGNSPWAQFLKAALTNDVPNPPATVYTLNIMVSKLATLNDSLDATRQVVAEKDGLISNEIAKIKARSNFVGLAVILVAVALAVFLSLLIARNITRAMANIGATVSKVGAGDLRVRFSSNRKDELGVLGRDIDSLLDSLTGAFRRIQAGSAENIEVKDQLTVSVSTATSSAVEIEANSASILGQLKKADEQIRASETDLNGVLDLLEAFHVRLGTQSQGVNDASRAVAELAQGIARISELSDQNRQAVEALLAESDRGREVFDRSFTKVAEINDSVSAIQDLVGAIAEIAGQTNILALNAAIEAAHAGDAGKGFAVVADEISKLAAASASSSAQIAATIQDVVGKIREAGATRQETIDAFNAIGVQIGRVSDRGRGIYDEVGRMNQGTHRIREVMESLSSGADDTTREADRIGTVANKLGGALGQVGRISHEVVSNIGEITLGLAEISRTVSEVSTQADRLGRVGDDLDRAVNSFQTENLENPGELEPIPEDGSSV